MPESSDPLQFKLPLMAAVPSRKSLSPREVATLGQVFTPAPVVDAMLALCRNTGRWLEPACGDGAFWERLPAGSVGIELDAGHAPPGVRVMDFFALPKNERFATIIGNPPYVRYQDIAAATRQRLSAEHFDGRSNLYLFFIEKCLRHLDPGGELVFITPRDFLSATSALRLNRLLFAAGTITEFIDLGDMRVFDGAAPNCAIWRFVRGDFSRQTRYAAFGSADGLAALAAPRWENRQFVEIGGHLRFPHEAPALLLGDIAAVRVGAVSGADAIYADAVHGNRDFVCSTTVADGRTRRMIWVDPGEPPPAALLPHKARLIARRVQPFHEANWWHWGRGYQQSAQPRIYVNGKTRRAQPFFVHECPHYDGAVLAIFPQRADVDVHALATLLNGVDWAAAGFVCDGRFLFTQRSLQQAPLPAAFRAFLPPPGVN
uniref:site-specific DNA-methyltransferase (adenine-specific) n=2 Tax=Rhodocyclus tenuis TaxID=1066 RepID=A0A840GBV1_RHOTE|nr:adenine-specific DNA-methyltransferase [Rhodocyclus tenuis]